MGLDAGTTTSAKLAERVLADTGGEGVDVGLMTIGEETAEALFDWHGSGRQDRHVRQHRRPPGLFQPHIGTRNLELHSMSISTSTRFMPDDDEFPGKSPCRCSRRAHWPVLDVALLLAKLKRAHQMIDERTHFGKIVLSVD